MKRVICAVLAAMTLLLMLSACSSGYKEPPKGGFIVTEHFSGYKLGIIKNQIEPSTVKEKIENPKIVSYNSVDDGLNALRDKQIHGLVLPAIYANNAIEKSSDFKKLMDTFEKKELCAISMDTSKLIMPIDAAITLIKSNGTIDKIVAKHIQNAEHADEYTAPTNYNKVSGRTITVGLSNESAFPYTYRDTVGDIVGINIDVAREIAADCAAELVIKEYPENKLTEALENGEVDFIMSQFSKKEDAPKSHIYSDSYFDASTYILLRSPLADVNKEK